MEVVVAGVTSACLIGGNARVGLPACICAGLSCGTVQVWGEDPSSPLMASLMSPRPAAVLAIDSVSVRDVDPMVVAGDSQGQVALFRLRNNPDDPFIKFRQRKIHQDAISAIRINQFEPTKFVCASENGNVAMIIMDSDRDTDMFNVGDSVNDLLYVNNSDICVAGESGLGIWDSRCVQQSFKSGFPCDSLAIHSSRPYQVACGGCNGSIKIFDRRNERFVCTIEEAHSGQIAQLEFNPDQPDWIFSTSDDGSVKYHNLSGETSIVIAQHTSLGYRSLDCCYDDIVGPLLMFGCEDESFVVKPIYELVGQNKV